ncbi:MAG: twin-arginine translocase TatA/TatE family subunit [Acidobacteria bacterium]|nr:twin-arginine translocase TatA/TatE family subunit [Acidobacteriota bacterium]
MQEIVIIFIIALIIFGPRKLPDLGKTIGKGLSEFKKASNELKQTWEDEVRLDKEKETMNEIIEDVKKDASALTEDVKKDAAVLTAESPEPAKSESSAEPKETS